MALFIEPFNDSIFGVADLTDWVDERKYVSRALSLLVPFEERGVMTDEVLIEHRQRTLNLLPFVARGGPPTRRGTDKRTMRGLRIPAHKAARRIDADTLLKVRAPGELRKWGYRELVNEALADMMDELQNTKEVHISNLLQGFSADPVTGTVLYDYFDEAGITQEPEIDFDLDNASPAAGALTQAINTMLRTMRDNAEDIDVSNVVGLCSGGFWDLLVTHPEVTSSYAVTANEPGTEFLRERMAEGAFRWRGVTWIQNSRSLGGTALVPTDKVLLFPITDGLYKRRYAPADFFIEGVTDQEVLGREFYVPPITIDPMHPSAPEYVEVELRSFPLNYIVRSAVLMIGRKT